MNKVGISIIIVSIMLVASLVWWSNKSGTTTAVLAGEYHQSEGNDHVPEGTKVEYKTNPPTSGNHYAKEVNWGVYTSELLDEQLVHNLEHGGVNVFYQADKISLTDLNDLTTEVKQYRSKVILAPRSINNTLLALASWEYMLKLDKFDHAKIAQFLKNNRNHGPEQVPD